jgi:hypothetical protein
MKNGIGGGSSKFENGRRLEKYYEEERTVI